MIRTLHDIVIFDLDGTLCDVTHRLHYLPDYDLFHSQCIKDKPYKDVINLWNLFKNRAERIIISGRNSKYEKETNVWLDNYKIHYDRLFMRESGDRTRDSDYKKDIYNNYIKKTGNVNFVFEDRDRVVAMWRELGLTCLQTKKGDY